ncbi:PAS domain-containing protein [Paenirhodobacter ferrireducens]|nr:PAS domain-containing protein [Sinirhodobacter ferrireducens]
MGAREPQGSMLEDWLARDGTILRASPAQDTALGLAPGAAAGRPWSLIYPLAARERLETLFALTGPWPQVLALELRCAGAALLPVTAVIERVEDPLAGPCLRLFKWPRGGMIDAVERLAEENEVIASILATSDDAGWCMEWAEPVDLSAPEQETIRQVFENGPRWRFCNDAMARLYRTPPGRDFNELPVHETFPRTPENEDFVRRLVRASFDVTASPSHDLRYDGVWIEVENDVRGHIRGNRLTRMWGTVRDVSKHARRAAVLRDEIEALEAVLTALPDAVLVIDRAGHLLRTNLAAEELLSLATDAYATRELGDYIELPLPLEALFEAAAGRLPGHPDRTWTVEPLRSETGVRAEMQARPLRLRETECLVLSLRLKRGPALAGAPAGRIARFRAER